MVALRAFFVVDIAGEGSAHHKAVAISDIHRVYHRGAEAILFREAHCPKETLRGVVGDSNMVRDETGGAVIYRKISAILENHPAIREQLGELRGIGVAITELHLSVVAKTRSYVVIRLILGCCQIQPLQAGIGIQCIEALIYEYGLRRADRNRHRESGHCQTDDTYS